MLKNQSTHPKFQPIINIFQMKKIQLINRKEVLVDLEVNYNNNKELILIIDNLYLRKRRPMIHTKNKINPKMHIRKMICHIKRKVLDFKYCNNK